MTIIIALLIFSQSADKLVLDLNAAIDYALVNNAEIRNLDLDRDISGLKVDQALANFYPSLTATGYYAYISNVSVIEFGGMQIPMGQHENYNVQLSLQQVIFAWGKLYDAYRLADIGRSIAGLTGERKRQDVRYSVTQSFYSLLVFREMVKLTGESYAQLKRHEDAVRKRYEAGLVPQFELLRAQVQVANLKPRVTEAENGLQLSRNGFQMLLGMPLDQEFELSGELGMIEEDFELEPLIDSALANRAEIKNLENAEQMGRIGRSLVGRANLPTIVAGATYAYQKPMSLTGNDWGTNLTFNIGFSWPLFSGFKNLSQYREAGVEMKKARLAIDEVRKGVTIEAKNAYFTFRAAREATTAAQENMGQADKALGIIDTRYKNGLATNLEYLDAQLAQMQARNNYLNALKDFHTAWAAIYRAIGKEQ
jgi:outer membrane protein TolC